MRVGLSSKLACIAILGSVLLMGYTLMSVSGGADPEYDLTIDNIPVEFNDGKTLYLDTQTNDRAFVIFSDYLQIRSHYLTFYDLNISDGHSDTNLVSGDYCYATIPSVNATLNSIRPVNNIALSTDSGSVTVSVLKNTDRKIQLRVNSSNHASLNIQFYDLLPYDNYKFSVDGDRVSIDKTNDQGVLEYSFDGPWTTHTLTLEYAGYVYFNDFMVKMLAVGFVIALGAIMAVVILSRRNSRG